MLDKLSMTAHITRYVGTTAKEVQAHTFNIFVGISLGNKYFNKANVTEYIRWALAHTKEDVLVVIADQIHAINYEVFNSYSPERAVSVALRKGQEMVTLVQEIINDLPAEQQALITAVTWDEVRDNPFYRATAPLIQQEFATDPEFKAYILNIIKENIGERANRLSNNRIERLAQYVLDELPVILNGTKYMSKKYTLHPYPVVALLDDLIIGLQEGSLFPELTNKLELTTKVAIVELATD